MLSRGETTHYDLRVASLLQIMFAVHPSGDRGHFPQAQPGLPVFPIAPCRGFEGFIIRGALYDLKGACHLLRSGEKNRKLTPLSSVAYGATPFLGKGALYCGTSRHHNPWARRAHQT